MPAIVVHQDDIDASSLTTPMVAPLPVGTTMAEAQQSEFPKKPPQPTKPENSNRPDDSRWTQQQLPMWQPMLTLNWAIVWCFVVAATSIALGVAIVATSSFLTTLRVTYDDGGSGEAIATQMDGTVADVGKCILTTKNDANSFHADHTCFVTFTLPNNVTAPLYVFYELDNVFQHHRRFVSSIDRTQFTGEWTPAVALTACAPLETMKSKRCIAGACDSDSKTRALFPCGIVANTMFNDIFWLHDGQLPTGESLGLTDLISNGVARTYPTPHKNPTWYDYEGDNEYLPVWRNPNMSRIIPTPNDEAGQEVHVTSDYTNSTAWVHDPTDARYGVGTGVENEFWRAWVEGAAVEPFRKTYARIEKYEMLPAGTTLTFAVQSNYFVRSFKGKKSIVIGEIGWFGSGNTPLGGFFIGVGVIFLLAGVLAAARKCCGARVPGDASALAWKKRQHGPKHKQH